MDNEEELQKLRKEIKVLRETVSGLTKTIDELKSTVKNEADSANQKGYTIFSSNGSCLLQKTDDGLSAAEAAKQWGKSRSRTSEVLNKLADDGHIVKYRDGREIKFRTADE
jgi:predicted  nucleic acid-binding Zn-ribbon protein